MGAGMERKMQEREKLEKGMWITGWCIIGVTLFFYLLIRITGFPVQKYMIPCIFFLTTGYYCPGCGGTRAVYALFHGHFIRSFLYHPFVLYAAVVGGWFLVSQTIERVSAHRIKIGMRYRDCYLWIGLAVVLVQFLVKLILRMILKTYFLALLG